MTATSELESRTPRNTIHYHFLHKYLDYTRLTLASAVQLLCEENVYLHSVCDMMAHGCVSPQIPGVSDIVVVGWKTCVMVGAVAVQEQADMTGSLPPPLFRVGGTSSARLKLTGRTTAAMFDAICPDEKDLLILRSSRAPMYPQIKGEEIATSSYMTLRRGGRMSKDLRLTIGLKSESL